MINKSNKCILLDRDGVLNEERGDYVYSEADFVIEKGVQEGLLKLKAAGFGLVVVTNQGGISKKMYSNFEVRMLHEILQNSTNQAIDYLLYAPLHTTISKSLASKPDSLMMERGLALTNSDAEKSWLIGDAERDLIAGKKVGVRTILIPTLKEKESGYADFVCKDFSEAVSVILSN